MWGRQQGAQDAPCAQGTIPTHVGKTCPGWRAHCGPRDDPHACGEDGLVTFQDMIWRGRSPRMWGRRVAAHKVNAWRGTIPTHVGKTSMTHRTKEPTWDDPHACGEDSSVRLIVLQIAGRSPRMWGRLSLTALQFVDAGTIPTHVGKTWRASSTRASRRDDPHACGEDPGLKRAVFEHKGRSPRMWGRHWTCRIQGHHRGTIPTHVGKTVRSWRQQDRLKDDPHACGEDPLSR